MPSLELLNVGDRIVWNEGGWRFASHRIYTIDRITKTQVFASHLKLRRTDGRKVGSDEWERAEPYEPAKHDPIIAAELNARRRSGLAHEIGQIRRQELEALSIGTLEQILKLIQAGK
jgi:hypothetical protein